MLKSDLIREFEEMDKDTHRFLRLNNGFLADDLYEDIYDGIKNDIDNFDSSMYEQLSERIAAIRIALDFKYGYRHELLKMIPELSQLLENTQDIKFDRSTEKLEEINNLITNAINNYAKSSNVANFLSDPYAFTPEKEGLSLSLESIKSIIDNPSYQECFINDDKNKSKDLCDFLVDYIRLSLEETYIKRIYEQYTDGIEKIWKEELENDPRKNPSDFKMLYSGLTDLSMEHVDELLNRKIQHSCSLITSNVINTYNDNLSRVGLLYPSDSRIITSGASDLGSNVFGSGIKNREKASKIATPIAIEKQNIKNIKDSDSDLFYGKKYNEILVDGTPNAVCIITLGEGKLNRFYSYAENISKELSKRTQKEIPLIEVNLLRCEGKQDINQNDIHYIAYHSILNSLGLHPLALKGNEEERIEDLITKYGNKIFEEYLELTSINKYTPEEMKKVVDNIIKEQVQQPR